MKLNAITSGHMTPPTLIFSPTAALMIYCLIRMSNEPVNHGNNPAYGAETGALALGWLDKANNKVIIPCIGLCQQIVHGALTRTPDNQQYPAWEVCRKFVRDNADWHYLLDDNRYQPIQMIFHHHVNMPAFASGGFTNVNNYYGQEPSSDVPTFLHYTNKGTEPHLSLIMNIACLGYFNTAQWESNTPCPGHYNIVPQSSRISNFCLIYNQPSVMSINQTLYFNQEDIEKDEETGGFQIEGCLDLDTVKSVLAEGLGDQLLKVKVSSTISTFYNTSCTTVVTSTDAQFPEILMGHINRTTIEAAYAQFFAEIPDTRNLSSEQLVLQLCAVIQSKYIVGGNGGKKSQATPKAVGENLTLVGILSTAQG